MNEVPTLVEVALKTCPDVTSSPTWLWSRTYAGDGSQDVPHVGDENATGEDKGDDGRPGRPIEVYPDSERDDLKHSRGQIRTIGRRPTSATEDQIDHRLSTR